MHDEVDAARQAHARREALEDLDAATATGAAREARARKRDRRALGALVIGVAMPRDGVRLQLQPEVAEEGHMVDLMALPRRRVRRPLAPRRVSGPHAVAVLAHIPAGLGFGSARGPVGAPLGAWSRMSRPQRGIEYIEQQM